MQGYQGMVDGGGNIQLAEWKTVSNILHKVCYFFVCMCMSVCVCVCVCMCSFAISNGGF